MPGWETGVKLAGNRMWTYSDPMWPKPAHCKGVWGDTTAVYNDCMTTNTGRLVLNHKYHFFIRLVTKAASTTILETSLKMLRGSQEVDYKAAPPRRGGSSCYRATNPNFKEAMMGPYTASQRYLVMGNVREPVGRFISAFTYFAERTGHHAHSSVADFEAILRKGFDCADYAWGVRAWTVKGFIHFLPAAGFFLLPHLLYAADNDTVPYVDKIFRMEEMGELVPYLEKVRSGSVTAAGPDSGGAAKLPELAMKKASVANAQAHEPVTAILRKMLSEQPEVMRLHCRAFIQDYVCFDYPLPQECEEMFLPANDSYLLESYLPAFSMPSISMPSMSMPSISVPAFDWSELRKIGEEVASWTRLDLVKLNRLLFLIIGLLIIVICWQQYRLTSNREGHREESTHR
eukprot:jgi/Mesvir1/24579/Mv21907-RA.1